MKFSFKKIALFFIIAITAFMVSGCIPMADEETNKDQVSLGDIQNYINSGSQREYSWYQRVTLTIPTEEGTASGSSVMKITWSENSPRINDAPWIPKITGEMPFVRLPNGDYVFALMRNEVDNAPAKFLLSDGGEKEWTTHEQIKTVPLLKGNKNFCFGDYLFPLVIAFEDASNQHTIQAYRNKEMCISVELASQEKPSIPRIEETLPWLGKLINGRSSDAKFETGKMNIRGKPLFRRITKDDLVRD